MNGKAERGPKLFHLVVVVGAAMTGTAGTLAACGSSGSTSSDECQDPSSSCYAHIAFNQDATAGDTGNGDGYAHIAFNPDAIAPLPDATLGDDASDDAPSDGSDSG